MKDMPHHIKKLNRRIVRSALREESEEEKYETGFPAQRPSKAGERKHAKREMRKERLDRTPIHDTEEERNRKMRKRVPVFDRNNEKPSMTKPTRKKTPRI